MTSGETETLRRQVYDQKQLIEMHRQENALLKQDLDCQQMENSTLGHENSGLFRHYR
jgi:hypothetical protein